MQKIINYYYIGLLTIIAIRLFTSLTSYNQAISYNQTMHQLKREKVALIQEKQELQFQHAENYSLHSLANHQNISLFIPVVETYSLKNASKIAENTSVKP